MSHSNAFATPPAEPRLGVYNFSAGPSHMPIEVVDRVRDELIDLSASGIGLMEHSHRGPEYGDANEEAEAVIRRLAGVGDDHAVIFMPGGATVNFAFLALNFLNEGGTGVYLDTSVWAGKAIEEARLIGDVHVGFDGRAGRTFTCPDPAKEGRHRRAVRRPIRLLLREQHWRRHLVRPAARHRSSPDRRPHQRHLLASVAVRPTCDDDRRGPEEPRAAGCSIVVARRDFIAEASRKLGPILRFEDHEKADSILNTPPTLAVRVIGLMAEWTEAQGGPEAMARINAEKSALVWDAVDSSGGFYSTRAETRCRSHLNVTFHTGSEELDARFIEEAAGHGMVNLKGSVGGMRASMYNAFPRRGAEILVDFMRTSRTGTAEPPGRTAAGRYSSVRRPRGWVDPPRGPFATCGRHDHPETDVTACGVGRRRHAGTRAIARAVARMAEERAAALARDWSGRAGSEDRPPTPDRRDCGRRRPPPRPRVDVGTRRDDRGPNTTPRRSPPCRGGRGRSPDRTRRVPFADARRSPRCDPESDRSRCSQRRVDLLVPQTNGFPSTPPRARVLPLGFGGKPTTLPRAVRDRIPRRPARPGASRVPRSSNPVLPGTARMLRVSRSTTPRRRPGEPVDRAA